jgi:hypothetical protein
MIDRLPTLALLAVASLPANLFGAAPASQRNYSVTSFDRIRVDGPYQVQLQTNVAPYARAKGSQAALDGVSIAVEGRTLIVRAGGGSWGGYSGENPGPVTIERMLTDDGRVRFAIDGPDTLFLMLDEAFCEMQAAIQEIRVMPIVNRDLGDEHQAAPKAKRPCGCKEKK